MTKQEKFKEIIKEGKWSYVLTRGVLYFGGLMFLFFIFWEKFILGYEIDNFLILSNFILFGIGGLIIGLIGWKNINKKVK